ncbi:glycosyltransferase [Rhodoferax sp. AJA081-3]|uniref:glycosyltransferase family 2 protein n=1 Tax=Rhodoferax sp. AJA081-3 TaxID=2752316 RepID=UPI001ADF0A1E|nr:glycosyltransferase [Rhodoferax sp. AJA081-3]QTN30428.1 glycosyltransferase [Rhodoferax sp. AJA081-3]
MSQATVSAILPVYNGVQYLKDSIGSVVSQTLQPMELFLIDDGSTDGSLEYLASTQTPFPKIVLTQNNKRQSAARNLAAAQAKGKYLAFLDHDDIWFPTHLEKLVAPMEADAWVGWAYSDLDEIDAQGRQVSQRNLRSFNPHVEHPKTNLINMLSSDMFIFPSAAVVRREAFEAIGGFDERLSGYEDDDLFLRLFRAGWLNVFFPESLVRYRRHASSSSFSERMWTSREIFAEKLLADYGRSAPGALLRTGDHCAPFYASAKAEYLRHLPHQRWEQCTMSLALMHRFNALQRLPPGRTAAKRALALR